jgi:predicted transposase YbfD/YdcC
LGLPDGIPDSDTFRRVFERIKPEELSKCLNDWVLLEKEKKSAKQVSIDGKTMRGSGNDSHGAYHVVSAWADDHGIVLGQYTVDEKSNEITAIPELLRMLDIEGSVVTIDAMGCQKDIAELIIDSGADYCLALKGNQKNLHKSVKQLFDDMDSGKADYRLDMYCDNTTSGSRNDKRVVEVISASFLDDKERVKFVGINTIVRVIHTSIDKGYETTTVRYFITSLEPNARRLAFIIRKHWSIESKLHWYLDVVFLEDNAKAKKDNSPKNLNILRKTALSLLLPLKQNRTSLQKMMFRAALESDYLELVLFGG